MPDQFETMLAELKPIADSGDFTSALIMGMTKAQLAQFTVVSADSDLWSGGNYGLFTAVRSHLARYRQRKANRAMAQSIRDALSVAQRQWLRDNAVRWVEHLEGSE